MALLLNALDGCTMILYENHIVPLYAFLAWENNHRPILKDGHKSGNPGYQESREDIFHLRATPVLDIPHILVRGRHRWQGEIWQRDFWLRLRKATEIDLPLAALPYQADQIGGSRSHS